MADGPRCHRHPGSAEFLPETLLLQSHRAENLRLQASCFVSWLLLEIQDWKCAVRCATFKTATCPIAPQFGEASSRLSGKIPAAATSFPARLQPCGCFLQHAMCRLSPRERTPHRPR